MARALFKSWFVDFDPVSAKVDGRDTGLPVDIGRLFPDRFDDKGLPKSWKQSTVGNLFSIVAGNTPSTKRVDYWDGPHAWATPKDMSRQPGPLLTRTERSLTEKGFTACSSGEIPEMSLLMSSRAPVGYLAFNALPVSINQGIAAFVAKTLSPFYAWAWCHENMQLIKLNANGSTFQEISKGVLRTVPMVEPSKTVHDAFVEIAEKAFARVVQLAEETEHLLRLRDQLLPKLLSGELRVADAEIAIVAA
jgi:type I restriction enzyme S subunit